MSAVRVQVNRLGALSVVEWCSFGIFSAGVSAGGFAYAGLSGALAGGLCSLGISGFYLSNMYARQEVKDAQSDEGSTNRE